MHALFAYKARRFVISAVFKRILNKFPLGWHFLFHFLDAGRLFFEALLGFDGLSQNDKNGSKMQSSDFSCHFHTENPAHIIL